MERIAVFVDDADHARHVMAPLQAEGAPPIAWVVVACAPRLTHRIGKYVAHSTRLRWRERWAADLRRDLAATLTAPPPGQSHEWQLARGPLEDVVQQLRLRHGSGLRLLDARRPKLGVGQVPLAQEAGAPGPAGRWLAPVAISSSLSLVLALTD